MPRFITGATPNKKRDELYNDFRTGKIKLLILSKVGNFAIDLPDANVAIQISGSFGSRQEEAQRLGRILRPKKSGEPAVFYSIVTRESKELDFAMQRQLFLTEQDILTRFSSGNSVDTLFSLEKLYCFFKQRHINTGIQAGTIRSRHLLHHTQEQDKRPGYLKSGLVHKPPR
jgi:superfamily II DNA or RNA helicase